MRYVTVSLILFVFVSVIPAQAQVDPAGPETVVDTTVCDKEVDEFTQSVKITCEAQRISVEESPDEPLYRSVAVLAVREETVSLHLGFNSESWNFLSTSKAYGLIDGENVEWPLKRVSSDTQDGGSVYEEHAVIINDTQLSMLASSDSFRLKLRQAVFDLSNTDLSQQAQYILDNK